MSKPIYWEEGIKYLSKDEKLYKIIKTNKENILKRNLDAFEVICRAIVGQLISTKTADKIWVKWKSQSVITPEETIKLELQQLISYGLFKNKAQTILDVSQMYIDNRWSMDALETVSWEEMSKSLLSVKGVGKWTVDIVAIFYAAMPDIFTLKDIGLVNAMKNIYGKDSDLDKISQNYKPYSTIAAWYLWAEYRRLNSFGEKTKKL